MKKTSTSKLVLFFAYIFPIILLSLMLFLVIKEKNPTYLNYIEVAFVASLGVTGYVTKWYMKKAAMENLSKVRFGIMKEMYEFQKQNKDFEVYTKTNIKSDAKDILDPLNDESKYIYKTMINDNLDTKIN